MNNIANQLPFTGLSPRQNPLPDTYAAQYTKQQSFSSRENLDTGLVVRTKEGDTVTLTTNSFSQMDAFMYDSKGVIQTESGQAMYSQNYREITLTSGQSFSFSVEGDLSEEELQDIETLLKGLDEVVSEVTQGDMLEAAEKALEIGMFDTVSSYAAEISYQRSYEMVSEFAASQVLPTDENAPGPNNGPAPAAQSNGMKHGVLKAFEQFFKKMEQLFQAQEEKLLQLAKQPMHQLLKHHLEGLDTEKPESETIGTTLETAMKDIDGLIAPKASTPFTDHLTAVEDE